MTFTPTPLALIILDGFGYSQENNHNAIHQAQTPTYDQLIRKNPNTLISGSGIDVGLPSGQMGNSEVGHITIGAGRVVHQELSRINQAIQDQSFFTNPELSSLIDTALQKQGAVHIMGLLSAGGVHSHEDQIIAMIEMAAQKKVKQIYIHAFLDGRDTPPKSANESIEKIEATLKRLGIGRIATLIGRYFSMDRDNRWDRIEKAYQLISKGIGIFNYSTAKEALEAAYSRQETDEFIQATCVGTPTPIAENDSLIFMNFRADRARELTQSFIDPEFQAFHRNKKPISNNQFAMLTPYSAKLTSLALSAFKPLKLINTLGEFLAHNNKSQLRIAETEKYAHVTFFFSGGKETQLTGEERILIPSPDVSTYDLQPQMSAIEITDRIIESIEQNKHDVIIVNFANADMVGHTGKLDATIQAIECLDKCLARLVKSLQSKNGEALITADHGNAEQMINPKTGQPHTAHTSYPVPLIYVGERNLSFKSKGTLADIAPSFLKLLGFHAPQEMTGKNLIELS